MLQWHSPDGSRLHALAGSPHSCRTALRKNALLRADGCRVLQCAATNPRTKDRPLMPLADPTGRRCLAFVAVVTLALFAGTPARSEERRIALSFDDAPTADGALFSGSRRTSALIRALAEAGVEQAAFFVTTRNLHGSAEERRLRAYAEAGHVLANHS